MRERWEQEDGAVLVAVLAFLTFFAVVVGALLGLVDTGLRTTTLVRDQGRDVYAADGAMQTAVSTVAAQVLDTSLATPFAASADPTSCPAQIVPMNGRQVSVACEIQAGSRQVIPGGAGSSTANTPAHALLALGSEGIQIRNNDGDATYGIAGAVASNGPVASLNNTVRIFGDVHATACSGALTVTGTSNCAVTTPFVDPAYPSATSTRPPDAPPLPPCTPTVTLLPGTYTDAKALSDLISTCNATFLMVGTYHFDFVGTTAVTCGGTTALHQLCIQNANAVIVAGTPNSTANPTECLAGGAQWIFSGDSRLNVQAGRVILCPEPHLTAQRISIFAKSPPGGTPPPTVGSLTMVAADAKSNGNPRFVPASSTLAIGETPVALVATSTLGRNKTADIMLNDFTAATLPPNATITAVRLRIRHAQAPVNRVAAVRLTVTPGDGSAPTNLTGSSGAGCALCISATMHDDVITLTSQMGSVARLQGASIVYAVSTPNSSGDDVIASLDGVVLEVDYTTPASLPFKTQTGCVLGGASPCDLVTTDGNNTDVRILGTIYAPGSTVNLATVNQSTQVAARGIVARSIALTMPTVAYEPGVSVSVPSTAGGADGEAPAHVILRASLPGEATPRAVAEIRVDREAATPLQVVGWTVRR